MRILHILNVAHAGVIAPPSGESLKGAFGGPDALVNQVCNAATWVFAAAIIFSIIFALLAAFEYMRSAGDPGAIKKANNRLVFLAIGVAVALVAFLFPGLIAGIVQAGSLGKVC